MQPVSLFDLAAHQARWLAVRQSAVSGNIANANTPGYRAVEVEPFEGLVASRGVTLAATQPGHIGAGNAARASWSTREIEPQGAVMPSQNTVTLENEMMKSGEVRREFELNTAIVKAFHRMLTMVSRG